MPRTPWPPLVRASLLTLFCLLGACIDSSGILPQARRLAAQQLDPGADLRRAEREAAWPQARWWQAYGDAQLDAWMTQALASSPSLGQASARVRRARALAGVVEAAEAPQLELQANAESYDKRTPEGASEAVHAFSAALRRDSTYAEAWAGLARTYIQAYGRRFVFAGVARDSVLRLAVSAAGRALASDRRNADAWLAYGHVSRQVDPTDLAPAIRSFRQKTAVKRFEAARSRAMESAPDSSRKSPSATRSGSTARPASLIVSAKAA